MTKDLVVIGGGSGGLVVASGAAQLGLQVTLIERDDKLGGECLHTGCVPSKALIHTAKVASLMRRGAEFGLHAMEPQVDLAKVSDHIQTVIDRIQPHDDPERFRGYGCEVLFGAARFTGANEVQVGEQRIRAKRFVVATGSSPHLPPVPGLADIGFLTNLNVFGLRELPPRLAVIGNGPIGIELAQAYARLGSQVTVLGLSPTILAKEDPEIARILQDLLASEGIRFLHVQSIDGASREEGVRTLDYTAADGTKGRLQAEQILVATGRRPNVEGLGLEAAGVEYSVKGIAVDKRLRTSARHIYACGDVCGPYQFTHLAEYQAGIIISNAVFRVPKKADYRLLPWVTYTDPELARVGLTEQQARDSGFEVEVLRSEFKDNDRAITEMEPVGMVKLVTHKRKILGATILGPNAGELLHEFVLAMKVGAKLGDISATIHAYPTLAQINRRTVNTYFGARLFSPATRRVVRWINRLLP